MSKVVVVEQGDATVVQIPGQQGPQGPPGTGGGGGGDIAMADLTSHAADSTSVHGISNSANLVYTSDSRLTNARTPTAHTHVQADITDLEGGGDVAAHSADTTGVHGIADTANLVGKAPTTTTTIVAQNQTTTPIRVKGHATQTADHFAVDKSDGGELFSINEVGAATFTGVNFTGENLDLKRAADSQPAIRLTYSGFGQALQFGPGGSVAPNVSLSYFAPPGSAVNSPPGTLGVHGERLTRLGWRNVKDWGAKGDGVTDDRAAIQACLDAGTGTVYVPPGLYMIGAVLYLPSSIRFIGAGKHSSVLRAMGNPTPAPFQMLTNAGYGGWTTATGISNSSVEDLAFDGNTANRPESTGGQHCIALRGGNTSACNRLVFKNLYLFNAPTMGIALQNCTRTEVSGCNIENCGRDGISFWGGCVWNRVYGNAITGCGDDHIAFNAMRKDASDNCIFADMRDNAVVGNTIGPGRSGGPGAVGIACSGTDRTTIAGNVIHGMHHEGITVRTWQSEETTKNGADSVTIVGNTISHTGLDYQPHAGSGNGIVVATGIVWEFRDDTSLAAAGSVSRVVIADNIITSPRGHAIWVNTSTGTGVIDNVQIKNNTLRGTSTGSDAKSSGILVGGTVNITNRDDQFISAVTAMTDINIMGNSVSYFPFYGIRLSGSLVARPSVRNNEVFQNGVTTQTPGISIDGCTDYVCSGNRSRNLTGSGQNYGIALGGGAGTNFINGNILLNNTSGGLLRFGITGTNYIWDNVPDTGTQSSTALVAV